MGQNNAAAPLKTALLRSDRRSGFVEGVLDRVQSASREVNEPPHLLARIDSQLEVYSNGHNNIAIDGDFETSRTSGCGAGASLIEESGQPLRDILEAGPLPSMSILDRIGNSTAASARVHELNNSGQK